MRQLIFDISDGVFEIVDAPVPVCGPSEVLVASTRSLVSAGTERMLVKFGEASYLSKALQQPERVKQVLDKVASDGLIATIESVRSKLSQPMVLGYSNVGVVVEVGSSVVGIKVGDRVISNGPHAGIVKVGKNLCVRVPDGVDDDWAAFAVIASIGLQGIRLAAPSLGESFAVVGVGLIGLLTVQLLRAHGCRVLAIDVDKSKLTLAEQFGADVCNLSLGGDPVEAGVAFSHGRGVDGVIITASTSSSDPISQAARMSRKRGRLVLVGVTGLELNRAEFYEKELSLQVSCSYGPGRYDSRYELYGEDYPFGYVRWTEQRNFEAVLDLMARGLVHPAPLISHYFDFEDAASAYEKLISDASCLGILLRYTDAGTATDLEVGRRSISLRDDLLFNPQDPVLGIIGAGNYASRNLIPSFKAAGAQLHTIVSAGGINSAFHGREAGFAEASSEFLAVLNSQIINTIVVATRHDTHAMIAARSLKERKHVFVEKPLAIDRVGLDAVRLAYEQAQSGPIESRPQLMVGFNRRFSPHARKMKELLQTVRSPKSFVVTVNAGEIDADHWTQDRAVGGGRIIGECCHFIDFLRFLAGSPVVFVNAICMGGVTGSEISDDKASIQLVFEDGSIGTIHYLANGSTTFPKERIEVFVAGRILQLENFRKLTGYGWPGFKKFNLWRQDKGQKFCALEFLKAIKFGRPAIPASEIFEVTDATLRAAEILRSEWLSTPKDK